MIYDPNSSEEQMTSNNLRAAIELYHKGEHPGFRRFIQDGKVGDIQDVECGFPLVGRRICSTAVSNVGPDLSFEPSEILEPE
ncbi:hypothetical protein ACJ72_02575 [Emergomyces africanus]|uniref:Uncharacterized protein n=1 Tax=Emergomyces africanus TaxID=1955775 RepID=A0A1B7P213_9EURO|nr:hypothetical protein ACJ72_02575 [Emergomyces africanus]